MLPAAVLLSAGQAADVSHAEAVLGQIPAEAEVKEVIADKGYDSKKVVAAVEALGAEAVIPSLSNRKEPRQIDTERSKDRNLAERCWRKAKEFRRVATRYEDRKS